MVGITSSHKDVPKGVLVVPRSQVLRHVNETQHTALDPGDWGTYDALGISDSWMEASVGQCAE